MSHRIINAPESPWQAINRPIFEWALDKSRMSSAPLDVPMCTVTFGQKWYTPYVPQPVKVLHNGPCTIVFWSDGTKTIVRCGGDQEFDTYTGFVAAFAKKMFGSTSGVKKMLKKITVEKAVNYKKHKN